MWTSDLERLLTLQDANTRTVLIGVGLLGLACGVVGAFALLRKRSLVSDAVSHAALPGLCIAYLLAGGRSFGWFLVGALVFGVLAAACISLVKAATRIKEDAATAIVIGSFFGLGIVLSRHIQNMPSTAGVGGGGGGGDRAGLDGFIFGKAASMVRADALAIAVVGTLAVFTVLLLYKELRLLCFDRAFAASIGRPTHLLDLGLMGLICICTVVGLPAVGVVMMVAVLVIPAAAARFWSDRLGVVVALSGAIGLVAGIVGTALSATLPAPRSALSGGWPTGPMVVLVAAAVFTISMCFAPRRGLVARSWRAASLRLRIARQHCLRDAYERAEHAGMTPGDPPRLGGAALRTWLDRPGTWLLRLAGLARSDGRGGLVLTDAGWTEARRVTRAHRLWELYLIDQASIAPDHVDRDADELEHILPPQVLRILEQRLAPDLARGTGVPPSPHPLDKSAGSTLPRGGAR